MHPLGVLALPALLGLALAAPYDDLMRAGRQALAEGHGADAAARFEEASHAAPGEVAEADAEVAMVHAWLSAGEYRRALAEASRVAGEHRGSARAWATLAWLELLGGQRDAALRALDSVPAGDPATRDVRDRVDALSAGRPYAPPALADWTLDAWRAPPPAGAGNPRALASGVILPGGGRVVSSASALAGGTSRLRVVDANGRTFPAAVESADSRSDVAVLRFTGTIPVSGPGLRLANAFPGSVVYLVERPVRVLGAAAPPCVTPGFLGAPAGSDGRLSLTVELPPGPRGGAALDRAGRLVGVVVSERVGGASRPRVVLAGGLPGSEGTKLESGPAAQIALPELYELARGAVVTVVEER